MTFDSGFGGIVGKKVLKILGELWGGKAIL